MRVIECNFCGETLSAANDAELRACVLRHMESEHGDEEFGNEPFLVKQVVEVELPANFTSFQLDV